MDFFPIVFIYNSLLIICIAVIQSMLYETLSMILSFSFTIINELNNVEQGFFLSRQFYTFGLNLKQFLMSKIKYVRSEEQKR